jgi:hypothetical protein
MASNAVPGFLPSTHGFRFVNSWPRTVARRWHIGLVELGIGDVSRGLCGGMAFAARDRFERGEAGAPDPAAPAQDTPLFKEIVDRQFDSFGTFFVVPIRFYLSSALTSPEGRVRSSVKDVWPKIKADIDAGRVSMVGLVRAAGLNPLNTAMGHQVGAFRYDASPERIAIGVYDPNHPTDDTVELRIDRTPDGAVTLSQSTGEPLLALLDLPFSPAR